MFVGRSKEILVLSSAYESKHSAFIPIYGRRRVGKSELIRQFISNHPSLYYVGKTADAELQKAEFCREAARAVDEPLIEELNTRDWKTILESVVDRHRKPGKLILAFDEFQWLAGASPELPSVLQELWDRHWQKANKVVLILCGSFIGFMEREVLGKKSPLFGRRTAQILLRPFGYLEAAAFHPTWSVEDQARAYFICGGVPLYHLGFDASRSFEHNLASTLLTEFSPLYREVDFLLREELREVENYYAVLSAVAEGHVRPTDIAKRSSVAQASLQYYLQQLVQLGYLGRRYPLTGKTPVRRHVRYVLADPFLRFWFRHIFPNLSYVQRVGGARAWRERIRTKIDSYWGHCFELLSREALPHLYAKENIEAGGEIGEYWTKGVQIDLVSLRDDGWTDLGECKWGTVRSLPALAKELADKVSSYPNLAGDTIGRRFFVRRLPKSKLPEVPNARWHSLEDFYRR